MKKLLPLLLSFLFLLFILVLVSLAFSYSSKYASEVQPDVVVSASLSPPKVENAPPIGDIRRTIRQSIDLALEITLSKTSTPIEKTNANYHLEVVLLVLTDIGSGYIASDKARYVYSKLYFLSKSYIDKNNSLVANYE